jgi:hypothetical protein
MQENTPRSEWGVFLSAIFTIFRALIKLCNNVNREKDCTFHYSYSDCGPDSEIMGQDTYGVRAGNTYVRKLGLTSFY